MEGTWSEDFHFPVHSQAIHHAVSLLPSPESLKERLPLVESNLDRVVRIEIRPEDGTAGEPEVYAEGLKA